MFTPLKWACEGERYYWPHHSHLYPTGKIFFPARARTRATPRPFPYPSCITARSHLTCCLRIMISPLKNPKLPNSTAIHRNHIILLNIREDNTFTLRRRRSTSYETMPYKMFESTQWNTERFVARPTSKKEVWEGKPIDIYWEGWSHSSSSFQIDGGGRYLYITTCFDFEYVGFYGIGSMCSALE